MFYNHYNNTNQNNRIFPGPKSRFYMENSPVNERAPVTVLLTKSFEVDRSVQVIYCTSINAFVLTSWMRLSLNSNS